MPPKPARRLKLLDGIGPKRAARITAGWADQKTIREIMVFLKWHGVGTTRVVRMYNTDGADAIPPVSENPFRLARDIKGVVFVTADRFAAIGYLSPIDCERNQLPRLPKSITVHETAATPGLRTSRSKNAPPC